MDIFGLIFDVDGVIADTEGVNARASIRVFAELFGIYNVKRADFDAGIGRGAEAYVQAAANIHGLKLSPEQVERATQLRQQYFLEILKAEPLDAFPGVLELINQAMSRDDFQVAIATSSTFEKSSSVLNSVGIDYKQPAYITGDMVQHKKPDPQLFLLAAERIGILPAKCVVIEDAPNGVAAAKTAGAKCIAVTNTVGAAELADADFICESLDKVDLNTIIDLVK